MGCRVSLVQVHPEITPLDHTTQLIIHARRAGSPLAVSPKPKVWHIALAVLSGSGSEILTEDMSQDLMSSTLAYRNMRPKWTKSMRAEFSDLHLQNDDKTSV